MAEADASNVQARWMHGLELNLIGVILKELDRHHDAVATHLQALSLLEPLARSDASHENYQYNVANTYQLIGDAYLAIAQKPGAGRSGARGRTPAPGIAAAPGPSRRCGSEAP